MLLKSLADQAAQAITNTRLFEEARRCLKLVQALGNIELAITGSVSLRVTSNVTLNEITTQLDLDAAALLVSQPAHSDARVRYLAHFSHEGPPTPPPAPWRGLRRRHRPRAPHHTRPHPIRSNARLISGPASGKRRLRSLKTQYPSSPKGRSRAYWKSITARPSNPTGSGCSFWKLWPDRPPLPLATLLCSTNCSVPTWI